MKNKHDLEDTEILLIEIQDSLRDINLKLDHLIRTYHKRFFEVADRKQKDCPER